MSDFHERIQDIFRDVFEDPDLVLRDDLTAEDVEGWDSLAHINLIIAVEKTFRVRFATAEISRTKEAGYSLGDFLALVRAKAGGTA
jgi:acyl carrier protein